MIPVPEVSKYLSNKMYVSVESSKLSFTSTFSYSLLSTTQPHQHKMKVTRAKNEHSHITDGADEAANIKKRCPKH